MFCPICTTPHKLCISDNAVQAFTCHCGRSPFQHSSIKYTWPCNSYHNLLKVPNTHQAETALRLGKNFPNCIFQWPDVKRAVRGSAPLCWKMKCLFTKNLSQHAYWKFLVCLNTESSINGFSTLSENGLLLSLDIWCDAIPYIGTLFWGWNGKISFHHQSHVQQKVVTFSSKSFKTLFS